MPIAHVPSVSTAAALGGALQYIYIYHISYITSRVIFVGKWELIFTHEYVYLSTQVGKGMDILYIPGREVAFCKRVYWEH